MSNESGSSNKDLDRTGYGIPISDKQIAKNQAIKLLKEITNEVVNDNTVIGRIEDIIKALKEIRESRELDLFDQKKNKLL